MTTPSFFDVDDTAAFGPVKEMQVAHAPSKDVNEFCERWHYSKHGGNTLWNYGLWDGFTLVGVVSYNLPAMETCESFFGKERWEWVAHMGRLVCAQDAPRNSESRLISGSLKMLKIDRPVVRAVVSFAAAGQGHIGYVYQATNALYCGTTQKGHFYIDDQGRTRSTKQGTHLSIPKALERGWTVHYEPGKYRYLYLMGNKTERKEARSLLKYPVLPYPKESTTRDDER